METTRESERTCSKTCLTGLALKVPARIVHGSRNPTPKVEETAEKESDPYRSSLKSDTTDDTLVDPGLMRVHSLGTRTDVGLAEQRPFLA